MGPNKTQGGFVGPMRPQGAWWGPMEPNETPEDLVGLGGTQ